MLPRLHLVTDDHVLSLPDFPERARRAVGAGGDALALHLRGPATTGRALHAIGTALLPVTRSHGTPLLVNDRVDVALALGAEGVQLATRSLPFPSARAILGPRALLGRSVHEEAEVRGLVGEGAGEVGGVDFLFAGTLYSTRSHPGRPGIGGAGLRALVRAARGIPLLGIGGVGADRVPEVLESGAWGVAVIRAVWLAPDPAEAVRGLLAAFPGEESKEVAMSTGAGADAGTDAGILVRLNGAERSVPDGLTVRGLLEHLELVPATVVVEHNLEILDRARYDEVPVREGDRFELVHFVGGG